MIALVSVARADDASHAEARARTSSLSWIRLEGAAGCVATRDLARDVEQRLGRSVFVSASKADVSVEGHIAPQEAGWRAEITIRDAHGALLGTRELVRDSGACSEMREALALIIAVMIDPDAKLIDHPAPAQRPRAEPPQEPRPAPVGWRIDAAGSGAGSLGLLPNLGVGATASLIAQPPRVPIALEGSGTFWFDNAAHVATGDITFSLLTLSGGLCPLVFNSNRVRAYGCAAGYIGVIRARSTGFTVPKPDESRIFLAGALEARFSVRLFGPFAVRAGLAMLVPMIRDKFTYLNVNTQETVAFQMSPVAAIGDVGLGVVFP